MTGRRGPGRAVRGLALAGLLAFGGTSPVIAFEPPPANKNFSSPSSVPDYFSNEAAPFGRASPSTGPGADRFRTAPVEAGRAHAPISQPPAGGTGRHIASARSRPAFASHARGRPVHIRLHARAASRRSIAPRHRSGASRSRYAAHSARHSRRALR